MARPGSRSRRSRKEEEEEDDRSSRRGGRPAAKAATPPATIALGVGVVVAFGLLVYMVASGGEKKPEPRKPVLAPAPLKREAASPPKAVLPTKPPPKPLTPEEEAWVRGLFQSAQPHVEAFKKYAKEGWDLKGREDNEGANASWVKAKKEGRQAIEIVNEALEDYEKFPPDRQDAYMSAWVSRLTGWQKELSQVPKVHEE